MIQGFESGLAAKDFHVKFTTTDMKNPDKINTSVVLRDIRISARGETSILKSFY